MTLSKEVIGQAPIVAGGPPSPAGPFQSSTFRTQVGCVGPDDSAVLAARRLENGEIVTNRIEDGTDERFDIPLDDRPVCQSTGHGSDRGA